MKIHVNKTVPIEFLQQETPSDQAGEPNPVLSLANEILTQFILNNTSRMRGDSHVRFCERLRGETPLCLLGVFGSSWQYKVGFSHEDARSRSNTK